jgi:catechol 2,3-dioxygenase-like lactoylglutathione lyase family enzyme
MKRLALIVLVVRDYDEAIAYFTQKIGFRLIEDTQLTETKRWVRIGLDDGAEVLLARAVGAEQEAAIGNQHGGRVGFFLNTDNFEREYQRLLAVGVEFVRPPKQEPYGVVAVFRDLYGNLWDLIEPSAP